MSQTSHQYLGTRLDPVTYYRDKSQDYNNPHTDGIEIILSKFQQYLTGKILDFGCGDGLATKFLKEDCTIGLDQSPEMISRFQFETKKPGIVGRFWDELPPVDSVVSVYALHLCPASRLPMVWFRLHQSGAKIVVIVSPFKNNPFDPQYYFESVDKLSLPVGPQGKTIHGRVYQSV